MIDETLTDANTASNGISSRLERMLELCDDARSQLNTIIGGVSNYANQTATAANQISEEVHIAIEQGAQISKDLVDATARLQSAMDALSDALDAADVSQKIQDDDAANGTSNWQDYVAARDDLSIQLNAISVASAQLSDTLTLLSNELQQATPDTTLVAQYVQDMAQPAAELAGAMSRTAADVATISSIVTPYISTAAGETGDSLRIAVDEFNAASAALNSATQKLNTLLNTLSGYEQVTFPVMDSGVSNATAALNRTLAELVVQARSLNRYMDSSADTLITDLKKVNDQFDVVSQLLATSSENGAVSTDAEDYYEDVSDTQQALENPQGKVNACRNNGSVEGDVDVGGITGSMAIEYDFDPEDDVTSIGKSSTNLRYQTKAVLISCVNNGMITAKKNYAGGAVGRMDLGTTQATESYGDISSSGGEFVGGIAGAAYSTVRSCYAMGLLSGKAHVGGIAGYASDVFDCRTIIEAKDATERVGAVIGLLDPIGEAEGNLFVHESLGGIDGISYSGKAEATGYAEMLMLEGTPKAFSGLTLTYVADGETVAVLTVQYGGSVSEEPPVPPKEEYIGVWEEYERDKVDYSRTVEAVYTLYATVIESRELAADTELPFMLMEGSFNENASLSCTEVEPTSIVAPNGGTVLTEYLVTATGGTITPVTAHLYAPQGKRLQVWVMTESGWERAKSAEEDNYLVFEIPNGDARLCVSQRPINWVLVLMIASGVMVLLMTTSAGAVILVKLKRKKKRKQEEAAQQEAQENTIQ